MSNQILTISMITREALRILVNNLAFTRGVNRNYDDQFAVAGAKIGDTINIRKPTRYIGRSGQAIQIEDQTETSVPLQLNTQFGVDIVFSSKDLLLSMDDFSKRFVQPAVATVANRIDSDGLTLAKNSTYNAVGTPGTVPSALLTYLNAGVKMDYEAAPKDNERFIALDPLAQATIVDGLKGLFQESDAIAEQYNSGNMGRAAGFNWSMDQNVPLHTIGAQGGTPLVDGASQTGSTLVTKGWTAAAANRLKKGDVFTIAGVYAVNPQNRTSTGQLRQFVVTSDFASDGSGNGSVSISPAINPPGVSQQLTQYQTVDSSPADGAAITVMGTASSTSRENIAYHRDAFVLGCADMQLPRGVDMAARVSDPDTGLSIRMVRAYDINMDRFPCRLDILYGWASLYPELACRIRG
jgi:hypothetical protein